MNGWRPMAETDVAAVKAISDAVHGAYTEGVDIYAERLRLYPAGCWVLEQSGETQGYLISHPWLGDAPPKLDRRLSAIPTAADRLYLHDLALLPAARGSGAAGEAVALVLNIADAAGFERIALTAVNGADAFWRKQGFNPITNQSAAYGEGSLLMERAVQKPRASSRVITNGSL